MHGPLLLQCKLILSIRLNDRHQTRTVRSLIKITWIAYEIATCNAIIIKHRPNHPWYLLIRSNKIFNSRSWRTRVTNSPRDQLLYQRSDVQLPTLRNGIARLKVLNLNLHLNFHMKRLIFLWRRKMEINWIAKVTWRVTWETWVTPSPVWRLSFEMNETKKKNRRTTATRNKNKWIKLFSFHTYNRPLSLTYQNPWLVHLFCSLRTIKLTVNDVFFIFLFLWSLFRKALQRTCSPCTKPFTTIWDF